MTFNFRIVRGEFNLEVSCTLYKLQLKPPLTIPDTYHLFMNPSENSQLHEVLPEVVHLDVHLEVQTFSDTRTQSFIV